MELPVQTVEYDVRQQWRNDASLRCADRGRLTYSILHDTGGEKSFHQSQDVAVGHFGRDRLHDDAVRNVVEEPLDVRFEYRQVPLAVESQDPLDRLVTVTAWNEPIRVIVKLRFKDRGEKPTYHFLCYPISNHRYAQRPELLGTGAFGDIDAA